MNSITEIENKKLFLATNKAFAMTLLYEKVLKSPDLEKSAWFDGRFVKKSMQTRKDLAMIARKITTINSEGYLENMELLANLADSIIDLILRSDGKGIQADLIKYISDFEEMMDSESNEKP